MKVFWAWQSDIDGKISRHFLRGAIEEAIQRLKQDQEIIEPVERENVQELHLDHDRKDVPGSPDLANTILEKIRASSVFIADVTPIIKANTKEIMNPNVAIELGFALGFMTDRKVLMILNEAFGNRVGLPFDIRHKAGLITYNLPEGSSSSQIAAAKKEVVGKLLDALKPFVKVEQKTERKLLLETKSTNFQGLFFNPGQELATSRPPTGELKHYGQEGPHLYLRVIPKFELDRPLDLAAMKLSISKVGAFSTHASIRDEAQVWSRPNDEGLITFVPVGAEPEDEGYGQMSSLSQSFRNGELWGINWDVLDHAIAGQKILDTTLLERLFITSLSRYLGFAKDLLGESVPLILELGAIGIKNRVLTCSGGLFDRNLNVATDAVSLREELMLSNQNKAQVILIKFFESVFESSGRPRPNGLNGFPQTV